MLLVAFTLVQSFKFVVGRQTGRGRRGRRHPQPVPAGGAVRRRTTPGRRPRRRDLLLGRGDRTGVAGHVGGPLQQDMPAYWASEIRRTAIRQVRSGTDERAGVAVLDRGPGRTIGRQDRLNKAGSDIPTAVFLLMLVAVSRSGAADRRACTAKGVHPGVHVVVVIAATVISRVRPAADTQPRLTLTAGFTAHAARKRTDRDSMRRCSTRRRSTSCPVTSRGLPGRRCAVPVRAQLPLA